MRDSPFIFSLIREMLQEEGYPSDEPAPISNRALFVLMAIAAAGAFVFGFLTGAIPVQ